jgi:Bacteriocin-protection, YdeI or OmpD-Associated/Domain of unknown function (DUF1905)
MRFKTTLELGGKTATGFRVPPEVVGALGKGKRPPVIVTINGYTYRNTVAVYGDVYMLGVAAEHREAAGVKAGDELEVDLELDSAPREVEVPADFAAALDATPEAKRFFETLSYSNKRRFTLSIEDAKTPETRQRRIERSVSQLADGRI